MKKELYIPAYKDVVAGKSQSYGLLAILLIATAVLFGGVSLAGLTGYDTFDNFPINQEVSKNYVNDPNLNRGNNPITLIEITPDKVVAGGTAYIKVDPGQECSWQRMKIYYWGSGLDSRKECGKGVLKDDNVKIYDSKKDPTSTGSNQLGGFEVCQTKTIPYVTSAGWSEGTYAVAVFDYSYNDWICQPFVVYRMNARSEDVVSWGGLNILDR